MRALAATVAFALLSSPLAAAPAPVPAAAAPDVATCNARQAELSKQAASFNGETMTKRLIDADLRRAMKESAEGDADECMEALDHAAKLLAGDL